MASSSRLPTGKRDSDEDLNAIELGIKDEDGHGFVLPPQSTITRRKPKLKPLKTTLFSSTLQEVVALLAVFALVTLFFQMDFVDDLLFPAHPPDLEPPIDRWNVSYYAISGFFEQSKPNANATRIGPTPDRFGLVKHSGRYWKKFQKKVKKLNRKAEKHKKDGQHTVFKVLYLHRHGESFGEMEADEYDDEQQPLSPTNGNGTTTSGPMDAALTPKGLAQANSLHALWAQEIHSAGGIPLPTKFYVSPLHRALQTCQTTFHGIVDTPPPMVMEGLRDAYGQRPLDQRHSKTWIHQTYPEFEFEPGFTEADDVWTEAERESDGHLQQRVQTVLDRILLAKDTYVAVATHGSVVEATLKLAGHRPFDVPFGGVIPILLNVTYTRL